MVGIFYVMFSQELEVTKQAFGILAPSLAHSITPSTLKGTFFCVFLQCQTVSFSCAGSKHMPLFQSYAGPCSHLSKTEWSWPGGYWGGLQRQSALLQISLVPLNGM